MISNMAMILGFILIISSILVFVHQKNKVDGIQKESRSLEEEFENKIKEKNISDKNISKKKKDDIRKESLRKNALSSESYDGDESDAMDKVKVSDREKSVSTKVGIKNKGLREIDTLGVLRIDKLGILLPIFSDTSNKNLSRGVGILSGSDEVSSENGRVTVFAGHRGGRNESQSFLKVDRLKNGDKIKITTADEVLYYKVVGSEIIEKNDWSRFVPESEKNIIYLLTCHPYPYDFKRLIIKAELYDKKTAIDSM